MNCSPWYQTWALGAGCAAGYEVAGRYEVDLGTTMHPAPSTASGRMSNRRFIGFSFERARNLEDEAGESAIHAGLASGRAPHVSSRRAVPRHSATPRDPEAGTVRRSDTVTRADPQWPA